MLEGEQNSYSKSQERIRAFGDFIVK